MIPKKLPRKTLAKRRRIDFYSYPYNIPLESQKNFTEIKLLKNDFKKVDNNIFEKVFSNVVKLEIDISDKKIKSFNWSMNDLNFREMTNKLEEIQKCINKIAKDIYKIKKPLRFKESRQRSVNFINECLNEIPTKNIGVLELKSKFMKEYNEFLNINRAVNHNPLLIKQQNFFIDYCKTEYQINLFCDFIKNLLSVFRPLKESNLHYVNRKIFPVDIKAEITHYRQVLMLIKSLRQSYKNNPKLYEFKDEDTERFPMLDWKVKQKILKSDGKRNFKYKASDIAYFLASELIGTTKENFKDILKKQTDCSKEIKKEVDNIPNIEDKWGEKELSLNRFNHLFLSFEKYKKEDWIKLFKFHIAQSSPRN